MRLDRLEQQIIDLTRHGNRGCRIERLTPGLIVREHLHVDPRRIHGGDAPLAEIKQLGDDVEAEKLFAVVAAMRAGGETLLFPRHDEVLLERNDFHVTYIFSSARGGKK